VFQNRPPNSASLEKNTSRLFLSFLSLFIISLIFWIWTLRNQLPAVTDLFLDIYPSRVFNIDQFRHGIIPLWNSYVGCGTPQMANWQSACFYPFSWIWNFIGNPDSISIFCILHSGLAGLGFFLWMRSQKVSPLPAFLGALSFSGSALFIRCWAYPHHMSTLTWIPWIFWSVNQSLKKVGGVARIIPVLFISLQILDGYPIFVFYTWLILILWFLSNKPSRQNITWFSTQLFLALGLTSLQWMPFGEFLTYCGRGNWWKEFPYFDKPAEYLNLLNPNLLGEPGSNTYQGSISNFTFNLYFGLVPLFLLIWGWISLFNKNSKTLFWKMTSLVLFFWMAGSHFFILKLFPEKILETLEPSKAVSLFLFAAATVAAAEFEMRWRGCRKSLTFYFLIFLSLFWLLDLLAIPFQLIHPIPNLYQQIEMKQKAAQIAQTVQGKRILSLSLENRLAFTGPDRLEKSVTEPTSYFLSNANCAWKIKSADYYLSIWIKSAQNMQLYGNKGFPYKGDLLSVAGVGLLMLPQEISSEKYQVIGKWKDDFLILNKDASPDTRWVGQASYFPNAPSILNILAQPHSGWRQKVYLEKNSTGTIFDLDPVQRSIPVNLNESDSRANSNRASWKGAFPNPGYVIFNDSYAPGWHAWVDGKPEPLFRADGLFMAIPLPVGGLHQVDFRYEPNSFRLGLFISLLSLGFFCFALSAWRPTD
jgi:hypothetical protein